MLRKLLAPAKRLCKKTFTDKLIKLAKIHSAEAFSLVTLKIRMSSFDLKLNQIKLKFKSAVRLRLSEVRSRK